MKDMIKSLMDGVKILIDRRIRDLNFDYTEVGTIKTVNGDGSYVVTLNGDDYTIKAKNGDAYSVGNVVLIRIVQNNFNHKYIECLRPY